MEVSKIGVINSKSNNYFLLILKPTMMFNNILFNIFHSS